MPLNITRWDRMLTTTTPLRDQIKLVFGEEGLLVALAAEARFQNWERRKDFLLMMFSLSQRYFGRTPETESASAFAPPPLPELPLLSSASAGAFATDTSETHERFHTLATVLYDHRMLGRDEEKGLLVNNFHAGYVAMFL